MDAQELNKEETKLKSTLKNIGGGLWYFFEMILDALSLFGVLALIFIFTTIALKGAGSNVTLPDFFYLIAGVYGAISVLTEFKSNRDSNKK